MQPAWLLGTATLPRRPTLVRVALGLGLTVMLAYVARGVPEPLLVGGWLLAQVLWLSAFIPRPHRPAMPSRAALLEVGGAAEVVGVTVTDDHVLHLRGVESELVHAGKQH